MADIKNLMDIKKTPGPAFDKILEDFAREDKTHELLPLDLSKMQLTTIADVVANLKALKATVIEGSRQANSLNKVIARLTKLLVWLTGAMAILALISLYVLISSGR